jgi:hypothetical protein
MYADNRFFSSSMWVMTGIRQVVPDREMDPERLAAAEQGIVPPPHPAPA